MKSSLHKSQSSFDNLHPTKTVQFVWLFCFLFFLLPEHKLPKIMKSEKSVWWLLLCTWFASRLATQDFLTPQDLGGLSGHGAWQSQASPPSLCLCVCSQSRTTACQYWQRPRWQAKGEAPHICVCANVCVCVTKLCFCNQMFFQVISGVNSRMVTIKQWDF